MPVTDPTSSAFVCSLIPFTLMLAASCSFTQSVCTNVAESESPSTSAKSSPVTTGPSGVDGPRVRNLLVDDTPSESRLNNGENSLVLVGQTTLPQRRSCERDLCDTVHGHRRRHIPLGGGWVISHKFERDGPRTAARWPGSV
eukprot:85483-Rhodomonas_salina.3